MIILDTDVASVFQCGQGVDYNRLCARMVLEKVDEVFVSIATIEEQLRGWLAFVGKAKTVAGLILGYDKLHGLFRFYNSRRIIDFTESSATRFQALRKQGIRIGTMDLRIAAITLAHNAILISRNLRDFRQVPGLRVEDWTL